MTNDHDSNKLLNVSNSFDGVNSENSSPDNNNLTISFGIKKDNKIQNLY